MNQQVQYTEAFSDCQELRREEWGVAARALEFLSRVMKRLCD